MRSCGSHWKRQIHVPDGEIFIIPARLEMCDTPEPLRRWQRVDLFEADGYKNLMSALRKYIASRNSMLTKLKEPTLR